MAQTYSTRPSSILGLPADSWDAFAIDSAALALADQVDLAVSKASAKAGSAHAVQSRVEAAVRRILTTERERAAEAAWREKARGRQVDVVWERPGDPTSLRAIVREPGR